MKKKFAIILFLAALVCFSLALKLLIFDRQNVSNASLRIDSFPVSNVFLNDKSVGKTPYFVENQPAGEYKLKLIPSGGVSGTFINWETKIKLIDGALTYVNRTLGRNDDFSGGQILSLEKLPVSDAKELAVISNPDGASVTVDGQEEGKASIILHNLSLGDHEIAISFPGYSDQVVHGKMIDGYRLNIIAKLAKLATHDQPLATSSAVSSPSGEIAKPYVVIKETGLGFLRVRTDPSLNASESARVKPGEKFPLLSEVTGWVKIKLPTLFGWVSDSYVEKIK